MPQEAHCFEKTVRTTLHLEYLLHLPLAYDQDVGRRWPLILFLHGAEARGGDLSLIADYGLPRIVRERPDFPFVVVSPQCPTCGWWATEVDTLAYLVDDVVDRYRVDERRLYLTGLSMGGYGTWTLASLYPDRFAAIAPICGGIHAPARAVEVLRDVPVWAFHGAKDRTVPVEAQQQLVDALLAAGGDVRFTVYPEAAHDSWTETYDNPALYEWFLGHSK